MGDADIMNKEKLKKVFDIAKENKLDVAVELTLPDREEPEIIIVKNSNLDYKLEYYLNVYDDELRHMANSKIQMINVYQIDFVTNRYIEEFGL